MKNITFIIKDNIDGTFTLQNGWNFLGGWTSSGNNLKVWKTLGGALRAVKREFPNNATVFTSIVPN